MTRKIFVFGMTHFTHPDELKRYIETDVFAIDEGRFDYSQKRDADLIVLSLDGSAYGHFDIASHDEPSDKEREDYPTVRAVYIVKETTTLYEIPVRLLPLGIKGYQFGKSISEEQFQQIRASAGTTRECRYVAAPEKI